MNRTMVPISTLALAGVLVSFGCAGDKTGTSAVAVLGKHEPAMMSTHGVRHQTGPFRGVKANTGYAIHRVENGRSILSVSDDFVIPDAPAPSWQIVDSRGNVYLLNQMKIKNGTNRTITVPAYIPDIAKVQVWCSYAEVLLGEASFDQPVR